MMIVSSGPSLKQKLERTNTKSIVSKNASLTHFWRWGPRNKETNICLLFIRFLQLLPKSLPTSSLNDYVYMVSQQVLVGKLLSLNLKAFDLELVKLKRDLQYLA